MPLKYHSELRGKIEIVSKASLLAPEELGLAYTPGVAKPCQAIAQDQSKVYDYTWKGNTILIVTDGSAVLGLGNIGPYAALPVMEGKSALFKEFGGVNCIPICLDTQDPDEVIDIVTKIAPAYGGINLEDISAPRCFYIEEELKKRLDIPVFHDDQHGTAIVVLAGLINSEKVTKKQLSESRIVINGAGAAATAITNLLTKFGVGDITVCDSRGIIFEGRTKGMNPYKEDLAKITNQEKKEGELKDALPGADIFIGVSVADALTPEMIKTMNHDPIIFALANPTPEIHPDEARLAGAKIIATGRSDFPNQVNNVLAFPGIFKGALETRSQITDEMKIAAARAIADCIIEPNPELIIPSAFDKSVAGHVAQAVIKNFR